MRGYLLTICVVFIMTTSHAQDNIRDDKKGIFATLREKLSAKKNGGTKLNRNRRNRSTTLSDTLTRGQSLNDIKLSSSAITDSIASSKATLSSSVETRINHRHGLDTMRSKISEPLLELSEKSHQQTEKANDYLEQKTSNVNSKIEVAENKIDGNLSKITDGTVSRPGGDINISSDVKIDQKELSTEKFSNEIPGTDINLPDIDAPPIPETEISISELKNKAGVEIPQLEQVQKVSGQLNGIDSKLAEGEQYENEIKQIAKGDLSSAEKIPEAIEDKVEQMEPLQEFSKEAQKVRAQQQQYQALIQKYKDKKALQEEVERKVKNVVNHKLNQYTPQFKESQEQIAKARKLNGDVRSFKDLTSKRTNETKRRPFRERIVPGLTVQSFTQNKIFNTDFGLQAGYKVTGRLLFGAGGVYRVNFSKLNDYWVKSENIYGYRVYSNFGLIKTLYAHGEFEALYGNLKVKGVEVPNSKSFNAFVGLGKRYNISQKFEGSIVALYNAHLDGVSSSISKFAMRIQFNYKATRRMKMTY